MYCFLFLESYLQPRPGWPIRPESAWSLSWLWHRVTATFWVPRSRTILLSRPLSVVTPRWVGLKVKEDMGEKLAIFCLAEGHIFYVHLLLVYNWSINYCVIWFWKPSKIPSATIYRELLLHHLIAKVLFSMLCNTSTAFPLLSLPSRWKANQKVT